MITDFILGIVYAVAEMFVLLLPEVGDRPEVMDDVGMWVAGFDYFLPVYEFHQLILNWFLPAMGAFILIRFVRFIRSG